jgi:hypothetical protein
MNSRSKVFFEAEIDIEGQLLFQTESVWSQDLGGGQFKLQNIPFFARQATFGDVVLVEEIGDRKWFYSIVLSSGSSMIRVVMMEVDKTDAVVKKLELLGCYQERFVARQLIAVCIPRSRSLRLVQEFLSAWESAGILSYEEPLLRHVEADPPDS